LIAPQLIEHTVDGQGFKVSLEHRPGFLRAYVHDGRDSLAVSQAMWTLLADQCRAHKASRLLVIEDLEGTVEPEHIDAVIATMADVGFGQIRTAFVEMQDDLQGSEMGSIIASERGVQVFVTNDEFVARHWLLYGDDR
jgi:hypothetical protein